VSDDIADSAGTDDKNWIHEWGQARSLRETHHGGKEEDARFFPDNFWIARRSFPCEAVAAQQPLNFS
jgi:hypothetical protein